MRLNGSTIKCKLGNAKPDWLGSKEIHVALLLRAKRASLGVVGMGLMDFEARGSQEPQAVLGCTPRTPDDEVTKKDANPNTGGSDEQEYETLKDENI